MGHAGKPSKRHHAPGNRPLSGSPTAGLDGTAAPRRPVALTIAGSDSSGGAGIQADLKTFSAFGVYGASVITALTAQNTTGVRDVIVTPATFTLAQLDAVCDDLAVRATKTGMLPDAKTVTGLASRYDEAPASLGPLVVDPVIIATSGDRLISEDAVEAIRTVLLPRARLITPNRDELAELSGHPRAESEDEAIAQARTLLARGVRAVLVKAGHFEGDTATDNLVAADGVTPFSAHRIETANTHGTGCTLSAAITAGLAHGATMFEAVRAAKSYLTAALVAGRDLGIGKGHGPVDHLVPFRPSYFRTE